MGCIYKITNSVNGKAYIGQSVYDAEKTRIKNHLGGYGNRYLRNALAKYGRDAFNWEIFHDGILPAFLDSFEIETIEKYKTLYPNGYNLTTGGNALRGEKNPFYGKRHSEETRQKFKERSRSEEFRRKMSEANKGRKHSEEHRRKLSESQKARWKRKTKTGG